MSNNYVSINRNKYNKKSHSYSLQERLKAGKYALIMDDSADTSVKHPWQLWSQARTIVFGDRIKQRIINKSKKKATETKSSSPQVTKQLAKDIFFFNGLDTQFNKLYAYVLTGRWNPLGWLEAIALFWVDYATLKHDPLHNNRTTNVFTGLHVTVASFFHALSKTINLVGTPMIVMALATLIVAVGATNPIGIAALSGLGILALGIFSYAAGVFYISRERDNGTNKITTHYSPLDVAIELVKEVASSFVLGILTPILRSGTKLKKLYSEHPVLAISAGLLGVAAVLLMVVFPHVGLGAMLGFKLGTFVAPAISALSMNTLGPIGTAVFTKFSLAAIGFGLLDLCVRGFKEIAGWMDQNKAEALAQKYIPSPNSSQSVDYNVANKKPFSAGIDRVTFAYDHALNDPNDKKQHESGEAIVFIDTKPKLS